MEQGRRAAGPERETEPAAVRWRWRDAIGDPPRKPLWRPWRRPAHACLEAQASSPAAGSAGHGRGVAGGGPAAAPAPGATRRRRHRGEEILGWILVPLMVVGLYWGITAGFEALGTSPGLVWDQLMQVKAMMEKRS